jgi:hypothetical protein
MCIPFFVVIRRLVLVSNCQRFVSQVIWVLVRNPKKVSNTASKLHEDLGDNIHVANG